MRIKRACEEEAAKKRETEKSGNKSVNEVSEKKKSEKERKSGAA